MSENYFSHNGESLTCDLRDIGESAADLDLRFEYTSAKLTRILRAGLESEAHYVATIEMLLALIARAADDAESKLWFDSVVAIVEQHPISDGNLFETGFREAIREFQPFVGVYGSLRTASAIDVDDLLQLYIKLFKVLFYKPILEFPHALLEQALMLAKRLDDHIETSKLYQTVAIYYTHYGDFEIAERYAKLAFTNCETIDDPAGVADAACTLAIVYRSHGRFASADFYIQYALKKAPSTVFDKRLATIYYETGVVYYRQDKFDLALSFYQKALPIFEKYEAIFQTTMAKQAMAQAYLYLREFATAEELLLWARGNWQRLGQEYEQVNNFFIEAVLEFKRGNLDRSLRILRHVSDMAYSLPDTPTRDELIGLVRKFREDNFTNNLH